MKGAGQLDASCCGLRCGVVPSACSSPPACRPPTGGRGMCSTLSSLHRRPRRTLLSLGGAFFLLRGETLFCRSLGFGMGMAGRLRRLSHCAAPQDNHRSNQQKPNKNRQRSSGTTTHDQFVLILTHPSTLSCTRSRVVTTLQGRITTGTPRWSYTPVHNRPISGKTLPAPNFERQDSMQNFDHRQ